MAPRFAALTAFLRARLSRRGKYGLRLTVGAFLLAGAACLFGAITEDVITGEPPNLVDLQLSAWLHEHQEPVLSIAMLVITHLHSVAAVTVLTSAFGVYLFGRRERYWLLTLLLTVFGGMLLNVVLKNIFQRARPHFDDPILTFSSYGFPSGHTMTATCFYGIVTAFALARIREWPKRMLVVTLSGSMVLLVGFSRVYLGAHYLTDVLGAMMEGTAWVILCLTAVWHVRVRGEAETS